VITSDGLELQGLFSAPDIKTSEISVLHIHGLAGNFYENRFIDYIGDELVKVGTNFLTFNNRGHDYISDFIYQKGNGNSISYKQIGAAFEILEESVIDIDAWIEFLKLKGVNKVILQGHSTGAIKAVYYQYKRRNPLVKGLILLSPSDNIGLAHFNLKEKFSKALELAQRMTKEGNGLELMPKEYFMHPISSRTFFNSFNSASPAGIFNLSRTDRAAFPEIESIDIPVLVTIGSVKEAFLSQPDEYLKILKESFKNTPDFSGYVLTGAPHNYLGYEEKLAKTISDWMLSRFMKETKN
jgi:pimeloyl-ACP methyl ester carboxylesterase